MSDTLKSCPLCEAMDFRDLFIAADRHYGISGSYQVAQCGGCSLVFLNPMYSDEELAALYPKEYYAYLEHTRKNRWKDLAQRLLGYRIGTKDPHFETPGTMLDLGCGSGWFLEAMQARGWVAQGVEINESAAKLGRDSRRLKIFGGTLHQANLPSAYFDYVRSNHSFEHMTCPNEMLDEIRRILKPQGKLLIGVPNIDSLSASLFKEYWWYLTAPVHPFSYSVDTLSHLLSKHNFRVERICFNSDYHGLLGSLQIWLNRKNGKRSVDGATFNNYAFRLICQWIANFIDLLRLGDCIELTAVKVDDKCKIRAPLASRS